MFNQTKILLAFGLLALCVAPAHANLCKDKNNGGKNNPRYLKEAARLAKSPFSSSDKGVESYDATVIRCNRDRDKKAGDIEAFNLDQEFPKNLSPRIVRGKIKYMGFFGLPYGYKVSRKNGVWTVQAALRFKFPRAETISGDYTMMKNAGISCSQTNCQVSNNSKVQEVIMKAWRDGIEEVWQLSEFKVDVRIVNLGELSKKALKKFEDKKAVWKVNLSKKTPEKKRATYYPIPIFKTRGISSGEDKTTIVHEFGHWMGLDDEYEEFNSRERKRQNLVCENNGGVDYMMCDMYSSEVTVKPVYAWIITRRYLMGGAVKGMGVECKRGENLGKHKGKTVCGYGLPILKAACTVRKGNMTAHPGFCLIWKKSKKIYQARSLTGSDAKCNRGRNLGEYKGKLICEKSRAITPEKCAKKKGLTNVVKYFCVYPHKDRYAGRRLQCSKDSDCASNTYCDKGIAGVGTNQCKDKKDNNKVCTNKRQCLSGRCYAGLCKSADECKKHSDCSSSKYCDKGTLTVGVNKCVSKKSNGKGCTSKSQCKSGRCYYGKCNDKDACKKDSECSSSKYCDKGTLSFGVNKCKSKRSKGTKCSRKGQCKSNKCKWLKCK